MRRVSEIYGPGNQVNPATRTGARGLQPFTEREQHAILTALAGILGEETQQTAIKAVQAVLANSRTVLRALELGARLNGELDSSHRIVSHEAGDRITVLSLLRAR